MAAKYKSMLFLGDPVNIFEPEKILIGNQWFYYFGISNHSAKVRFQSPNRIEFSSSDMLDKKKFFNIVKMLVQTNFKFSLQSMPTFIYLKA